MQTERELLIQTEAAQSLLANIRDIIGDDEQAAADAVEGETGLIEVLRDAVARIGELGSMQDGIKAYVERLKVRCARLEEQEARLRVAVQAAMETCTLKKHEFDIATVSVKPVPPKAIISSEPDIPSRFWTPQPPNLDKKAVLDALKAKEDVPGAALSNGATTIAIKFS